MGESSHPPPDALAKHQDLPRTPKVATRVLTRELAEAFAKELLSDVSHSVSSAARAVGIKPSTVRMALWRAHRDSCKNLEDEEICDIVAAAKEQHIKKIREYGFTCAGRGNRAGIAWMQWQSEVQDPLHHPRKQEASLDAGGADGGGALQLGSGVRYVVHVPGQEPEEEP